jgi:hypothetical protein
MANGRHYYTRAAAMDLYEVLRQFIDSTDQMDSCFVAAVASPEFRDDEQRGLDIYQALKMRVADEVRAIQQDNPMASLVRVDSGG